MSTTRASGRSSAPPITSTITASSSWGQASEPLWPLWPSDMPGEAGEVRVALLQEGVASLDGLLGHVRQPRRLPGEELLAHEPVVDQVERVLEHPLGGGALGDDLLPPVQRGAL